MTIAHSYILEDQDILIVGAVFKYNFPELRHNWSAHILMWSYLVIINLKQIITVKYKYLN